MKPDFDDPRLTAYALGELDDAERVEVESLLATSPEARQWVEEVRETARNLEARLRDESYPELTRQQIGKIESRLSNTGESTDRGDSRSWVDWVGLLVPRSAISVLILLAIAAIFSAMFLPALSKAKSKAARITPQAQLRQYALDQQMSGYLAPAQASLSEPLETDFNTESYAPIYENDFQTVAEYPLSTFSIDVDTASYAIIRRFLSGGQLPPPDAVRIEEMINYFSYDYPQPTGDAPFSVKAEIAGCPWKPEHRLVKIGLKGRELARDRRPPSNLVFLIDVSGSMQPDNKLPLLKESLKMLTRQLTADDRVSIVVYAGSAGEVLPATQGSNQRRILRALNRLEAGGSTHGSEGIRLAYAIAAENFIDDGVNRVILCTDGDFNVGVTSPGDLLRLIEDQARSGVFLSVLGFGMGNYKDSTMELLADKGNGNYAYIDTLDEGRKILVEQMSGTLVAIAKDVKIQVEFNPAQVGAYRLIGYENRLLRKEDFNDDRKDAGEIGAGHTVTALYEVVPAGMLPPAPRVDPLKYQQPTIPPIAADSDEWLTLKLRYKEPDGDTSRLLSVPVTDRGIGYARASADFKFASAVAAFGMILRNSEHKGTATLSGVIQMAEEGLGSDREGYRAEFLSLVEKTKHLSKRATSFE